MIGARVCSRIAARSSAGSDEDTCRVEDDLEVAAGERGGSLADALARSDQLEVGMGRERRAERVRAVAGARHVDPERAPVVPVLAHQ